MIRNRLIVIVLLSSVLFLCGWSTIDEGMWMLTQLNKLPWPEMQKHGLELTPDQIYNPDGTSLKDAIVLLGGGTGSFISTTGLIITNHHVAFGAIQSVSSVQEDYLQNGFYAKTTSEELSIPTYSARIVASIKDVTSEVLGAVSDTMGAEARSKAIQAKIQEIQKAMKGTSDNEYSVSETFNGVKYFLFGYEVLRDVRLVYGPPGSLGNYGGEIDNWIWPRHTCDFALMRAYVGPDGKPAKYSKNNIPFKPKKYLPISLDGYSEGSFAMIMGFPGRTFRYRTTAEIELAKNETLPLTIDILKKRMDIMEAAGKKDRAVEIKFASRWRGLANVYKNYEGTLEGMKRSDILVVRRAQESKFQDFLNTKEELKSKYGQILSDISSTYEKVKTFNRKQIVLGQLLSSADVLRIASEFRGFANSFVKDSTGAVAPRPSRVDSSKDFVNSTFKIVDLQVDKEILTALLLEAADLPTSQQVEVVHQIVGDKIGERREKAIREFVDDLYRDSRLTTTEGCTKLMAKSADDIRDDKFVKFAIELDKDNAPIQVAAQKFNAQIGQLRTKLLEAWMAWKGPDLYPDANRTLRLTYGKVQSYDPRDAVHYRYYTTLSGVMEKETGEDPFIVPPKVRQLWEKKDFGRYVDPKLGDIPTDFLADLDITGGNSGSPVINGKGELIGLAFDGNWEAVVGDYIYQPSLNRSICVDMRFVLFILDKYSNADNILRELTIQ